MPVQMIELEEMTMVEISDEDLEGKVMGGVALSYGTQPNSPCCKFV
jgi:hypothetical protein